MNRHPLEELSAFADGELTPDEARRIEEHLRTCTECARELAVIRAMGGAIKEMKRDESERSVWANVNRRITRPIGWLLVLVGSLIYAGLAVHAWMQQEFTLERLAITAVVLGLVFLALDVAHKQYREWKASPYKDIER